MAFDEQLAGRVREFFKGKRGIVERKMFGGIAFMYRGNMTCGVEKKNLMVRVGPQKYDEALTQPHARPMDFTGRPLKGFVYVSPPGVKTKPALKKWVQRALDFVQSLPAK